MATLDELMKRLNYLVDENVGPDEALLLFNECNEDLSESASYSKYATADFIAGQQFISLPADLLSLVELRIKPMDQTDFTRMVSVGVVQPSDTFDISPLFPEGKYVYEWFGDHMEIRPAPKVDGSLQIRYYGMLPKFKHYSEYARQAADPAFLAQVSALRPQYHRLYSLYAAARYMQNWMDSLDAKNDYMNEYLMGKQELARDTQARKTKTRSRTVYRTSDFV